MDSVQIIDSSAEQGCPTSYFLTQSEIADIKPNYPQHRVNFIFKHKIPLSVESGYGKLLVDKYESLEYDGLAEKVELQLDSLDYHTLKKLAFEKGVAWKDTYVSKTDLIQKIEELD
tara:strand:- start:3672 stop:4019 length:348 start_codon:yes stop_codon:yes gene_type:complete